MVFLQIGLGQRRHRVDTDRGQAPTLPDPPTSIAQICNASKRVCDLASDFPKSDEEVQERCTWAQADCDGARVSCAECGGSTEDTDPDDEDD